MEKLKGLAKAADFYENRHEKAKEYKEEGKKIAGYFCCYVPVEILSAANYVPVRILGDMSEPITKADNHLPNVMCVFYRSVLDLALKGRYDYLDGFFAPHACDAAERVGGIWRSLFDLPCSFYIDEPHTDHEAAAEFFKEQLKLMIKTIEEEGGSEKLNDEVIKESIELYNRQRELVWELYEMRKEDPPPVSGTEVLQVLISLMYMPVEEGISLIKEVLDEVKSREITIPKKPRMLVHGCLVDDVEFTKLIEDSGFNIVMDDTAIGSRSFGHNIELTADPLDGLVDRYLNKIVCPRTFRTTGKTRQEDLENRFGYLRKFISEWKVDAVYMNIIRNCDIHGYEIPEIKYYFEEVIGIPAMVLEQDYTTTSLAPLRTRFQAFAESME